MATTTYDINLRYLIDASKATQGSQRVVKDIQAIQTASNGLDRTLMRIGGAIMGAFGAYQAKKSLIDFNSGIEQAQITMAGLMNLNIKGSNFADNMKTASDLVKQFQQDAKASVGTTKDFVDMASMLVQPVTAAGGSMSDLREMTKGSVVAARSFGIAADVAARDVDQAVRGQYRSVDQFSSKILGPMGFAGEEGRMKFNAMDQSKRMATMKAALNQPAVQAMAKAQEGSFEGVLSTLQDNLQMLGGKIGVPLFKRVTEELKRWNEWFERNKESVDKFVAVFSDKLVKGFEFMKEAMVFAVEHWKEIAAIVGGLKVASIGQGLMVNASSLAAAAGAMPGIGSVAGAVGGIVGTAGLAVTVVGMAVGVGTMIATALNARDAVRAAEAAKAGRLPLAFAELDARGKDIAGARGLFNQLKENGLASDSGLNREAFKSAIEASSLQQRTRWADALGVKMGSAFNDRRVDPEVIAEAMARRFGEIMKDEFADVFGTSLTPGGNEYPRLAGLSPFELNFKKPPEVKVTINRIEVASDDPDRFVMGMMDAFRDAARNPGQAFAAVSER